MERVETAYKVIAMGKTGSGKSSVLNSLINAEHFKVSDSILSETKNVNSYRGRFKGRLTSPMIEFIDTPGFFDSSSRDNEIIAKIAMSLHQIGDGLNLILFCFPAYEIRLDASMQASWRFLRLVMDKAVYEHVVIVLTHGSRLERQELEKAIVRMTTQFIPYLANTLKCKVKEEILIYRKGEADDGLEGVLKYITSSKKYKPRIMEDLGNFWNPEDPLGSIEYLLQNSHIFNKIQDLLTEVQSKNDSVQSQMEEIKREMERISSDKSNKAGLTKLAQSVQRKFREENKIMQQLQDNVNTRIDAIQTQLGEKDMQIENLVRELNDIKSKTNSFQEPFTTRAKPVPWEKDASFLDNARSNRTNEEQSTKDLNYGKYLSGEEKYRRVSWKDYRKQAKSSQPLQEEDDFLEDVPSCAAKLPVSNYKIKPPLQRPPVTSTKAYIINTDRNVYSEGKPVSLKGACSKNYVSEKNSMEEKGNPMIMVQTVDRQARNSHKNIVNDIASTDSTKVSLKNSQPNEIKRAYTDKFQDKEASKGNREEAPYAYKRSETCTHTKFE
eukprot:TRINITY_DN9708_c0_g1_i9.p1 TRINITY_DN9708_c0_g1~~TRINITY_DN9708_c0_g1_i9.p1  ORF type:complete len:553 (-),score=157.15 TRINITY_DN9708_c0_g1_i9:332-1990(-)